MLEMSLCKKLIWTVRTLAYLCVFCSRLAVGGCKVGATGRTATDVEQRGALRQDNRGGGRQGQGESPLRRRALLQHPPQAPLRTQPQLL